MAGRIRKSDIDEVRSRVNIADIVGDYVALKSAGIGSLKGLCPFHDERSPSFHVRTQNGRYHCFGCGEGGDVYSFLQKMDHVTFAEAVERMAQRVGYELHYEDGGAPTEIGNRARLLSANRDAAAFFIAELGKPGAEPGRQFLKERGFDAIAAQRFDIGYAPKSWDELTKHLRAKGYTDVELSAAGLVSSGDRGVYDRFRGRLIWPIRDLSGETVGFGARRLFDDDKGPKYLNTPDTPIYHKSQVLYGLDLAKRDIARGHQVVVVEGYTDVMACHMAGVTTAVATCGTAFGVDHIKILRRVLGDDSGSGQVIFTFDPDAAGQKAAVKAFGEEQRFAAQTYVAVGPDGLDPCDLRIQRGDDAVRLLIDTKKPMFEFMLRQILNEHNLDSVEGRVSALRAAAPVVAEIRDPSLRPGYTRELTRWLGMELTEVAAAVAAVPRRAQAGTPDPSRPPAEPRRSDPPIRPQGQALQGQAPGQPQPNRPLQPGQQQGGTQQAVAEAPPAPVGPTLSQLPTNPSARLERDALMAMLQHPTLVGSELVERAARSAFSNQPLAAVRDAVAASLESIDSPDWLGRVTAAAPESLARLIEELGVAPIPHSGAESLGGYAQRVVGGLVDRDLLRRKEDLVSRLQRTQPTEDPDRFRTLQRALVALESERRALRERLTPSA